MGKKIAFIGAGSYVFTRNVVRDVLTYPAFDDCTIALMDIDPEKLEYARKSVLSIADRSGSHAKVEAATSRAQALEGADGVVCSIRVGSFDVWRKDIEIPKSFGVDLNVGDTRGPAGIFRALRSIPVMLELCRDIEKYCPQAIFLNYTNPMAMLCRAMQDGKITVTGLCHSIPHTARMLAEWIGAPMEEITYLCAGINHMAWFLEYKWKGKDAAPLIAAAIEKPEIYNQEIVRNEVFRHLGYYVTESSGHFSEYSPWFRKRPELIERYCLRGTGENPGIHALSIKTYLERQSTWRQEFERSQETFSLERGDEYAASIFNAVFGDGELFEFNGNVQNYGLIDNLPAGCCVEVPVVASRAGLRPIRVGLLPGEVAALTHTSAVCEELAVEGALTGDPRKIYCACCNDPLTGAVLSLEEIRHMVKAMFQANAEFLPQFKRFV